MLLTLMIAPLRPWSMTHRANARPALRAPMALTAKNRAASAGSASINGRTAKRAALLTRMSTAPRLSTVVAIIRSQSAASATSAATATTGGPHSSSIAAAERISVSLVRPAMATQRSLTGEGARDRIADPRAAAGHEGDLAVELQRLPTRRFRHRWSLAN